MIRVLLVSSLLLSGCAVKKKQYREVTPESLMRFHESYDPFFRKYFSCPEHGGEDTSSCSGWKVGKIDKKALERARDVGIF